MSACHWGTFLSAFSGSIIGWVVVTAGMLVIERFIPPRRRN
jgi:hypothetical protein